MAEETLVSVAPEKTIRKVPLYPDFPELARSDTTIHPSYTNLNIPYRVFCRHRYHRDGIRYRKQFIKELRFFEKVQWKALDGVRVHREFSDGLLTVQLPRRQYINRVIPDPLTPKERTRLENILRS